MAGSSFGNMVDALLKDFLVSVAEHRDPVGLAVGLPAGSTGFCVAAVPTVLAALVALARRVSPVSASGASCTARGG